MREPADRADTVLCLAEIRQVIPIKIQAGETELTRRNCRMKRREAHKENKAVRHNQAERRQYLAARESAGM